MNNSKLKLVLLSTGLTFFLSITEHRMICAQLKQEHQVAVANGGFFYHDLSSSYSELKKVSKAANQVGLTGRWIVQNVNDDGQLSQAQIGQKPKDVITIGLGGNRDHRVNVT